jgi:hypothetical protein
MQNVKVQQVADHRLDAVDAGVAKLDHLVTLSANNVVVLAIAVAFFVLCEVAAKLVLAYKALLYQQIEGIIDRGAAHLKVALLHTSVEFFHIEVTRAGVNFFEDGVALGGFAEAFIFEVGGEDFFDFFEPVGI